MWFREGIHHHSPEGDGWEEVSLPGEVVQISCGPGDLVWAVLWEGQLIVREGITRDCPQGDWLTEEVCVSVDAHVRETQRDSMLVSVCVCV